MSTRTHRGFTLIEVMATMAVIGILLSIALPAYSGYIQRSRVPPALDGLSTYATRLEQRFQDVGNYGTTVCAVAAPTGIQNFSIACTLTGGGQGFTATATGTGTMTGYSYTVNHQGVRATTAHPRGLPATSCWTTRGTTCDS